MATLEDVMTPEMYRNLRLSRKGALSIFRDWRCGLVTNQEAARSFVRMYNFYFWKAEYCCGTARPHCTYCTFASRLLRSAEMLMGEEWISYHV